MSVLKPAQKEIPWSLFEANDEEFNIGFSVKTLKSFLTLSRQLK